MTPASPAPTNAVVIAVHTSAAWSMSKAPAVLIDLDVDRGVRGDVHAGPTVRHRPAAADDPTRPNDRQVHLIATETYAGLRAAGFEAGPGSLGDNITTSGLDLLSLRTDDVLSIGPAATVRITGKRHPRPATGEAPTALSLLPTGVPSGPVGVFGVVLTPGRVTAGDSITVTSTNGAALEAI